MTKIVGIESEHDKNLAAVEKLKREADTIIELYQQIAKIKYGAYKAFIDAGFTKEEALVMVNANLSL